MSETARIIVVDDEPDLRLLLEDYLGTQGFAVRTAANARELERCLAEQPADLLILDVNMPGEDGVSLARRLRAGGMTAGVVMLTAAGAVAQRLTGLDAGADDYVAKPFEPRELLARIRSVLRRVRVAPAPARHPAQPRFGRCTLDLDSRRLLDEQGAEVPVTAMEFDLLAAFVRHPRQTLARERLSELAHGRCLEPGDRSIDIRIARLRRKLEADPDRPTSIRTLRGEGYRYEPDG